MKALVVTRFDTAPQMGIEERPIPALRAGHTLVKMHAATVNPLSNQVRCGRVGAATAPLVLSNDGSGIVEQSSRFEKGMRVALFGGGQLGITEDGLQQQWALVEDKRIIVLPDHFDLDEGAALPVNYITAYQALTRVGQVKQGQSVLVSGASGSLGHALIQTARALGAVPIGVVSSSAKVQRAIDAGAEQVIDLSRYSLVRAVQAATDGQGVDLAMDVVGGEVLGQLLLAVKTRGSVVSIGFAGSTEASIDVTDVVIRETRLLGYDAHLETDEDVEVALAQIQAFIARGLLRPAIDSTYPLEQFEQAYQRLTSRHATGTIILHLQSGESFETPEVAATPKTDA